MRLRLLPLRLRRWVHRRRRRRRRRGWRGSQRLRGAKAPLLLRRRRPRPLLLHGRGARCRGGCPCRVVCRRVCSPCRGHGREVCTAGRRPRRRRATSRRLCPALHAQATVRTRTRRQRRCKAACARGRYAGLRRGSNCAKGTERGTLMDGGLPTCLRRLRVDCDVPSACRHVVTGEASVIEHYQYYHRVHSCNYLV